MRSKKFLKQLFYHVVTWDYKDVVPWEDIQPYLLQGYVYVRDTNTESDQCGLILTKIKVSEEEAVFLYNTELKKHFGIQKEK